jgi:hypothetical protein
MTPFTKKTKWIIREINTRKNPAPRIPKPEEMKRERYLAIKKEGESKYENIPIKAESKILSRKKYTGIEPI